MKTFSKFLSVGLFLPLSLFAEITDIDAGEVIKEKINSTVSTSKPNVVILNNQKVDQKTESQLSNQPVVRVIGTPIAPNYATELKKSREEAEILTEQKIVEKLESSRLRDEQGRLNKLFKKTSSKAVVSTSAVGEENKTVDQSEIYTEVVSSSTDVDSDQVYIGIYGGQNSNLTRALENINSRGSFGLSFGAYDESGLGLEVSFFYSKHEIHNYEDDSIYNNSNHYEDIGLEDVHQLSGTMAVIFTPLSKRFKPYFGPALSYNHWLYSHIGDYEYKCGGLNLTRRCDNQIKTDSVDLGARVGMDFLLTKRMSVGFDMHVNILNIYNNRLSTPNKYADHYDYDWDEYNLIKLEETNWIIASINAKLYF